MFCIADTRVGSYPELLYAVLDVAEAVYPLPVPPVVEVGALL